MVLPGAYPDVYGYSLGGGVAEMFRRLGGGVFGDLAPELPASQLAILPSTTHVGTLDRSGWISSMVTTFLAA
jgi:hypothetical protein